MQNGIAEQPRHSEIIDVCDKIVLVAGATGGLGAPIAHMLMRQGAVVIMADMDEHRLDEVAADAVHGAKFDRTLLDVRDPQACERAVGRTADRYGRIDVLINATGVYRTSPSLDLPDADWRLSLDVNLTGAFFLARAAGRQMVKQGFGSIITIASVSSAVANPDYAAYAASKAAIAHVTRVLALEWAASQVRVNAIGPAVIPTPLSQGIIEDALSHKTALSKIPMGRFGAPEDLFGVVLLLASNAGAFITGQTLYVDGGRTIS